MNLNKKIQSYILSNIVSPSDRKIGVEEECIIYSHNNRRIPVNSGGEFSATDLLVIMNDNVGRNGSYSLEPGGQLEWSSPPRNNLFDLASAQKEHRNLLNLITKEKGLKIIYYGVEPNYSPGDIDLINQLKYQLMDKNMKNNGTMGQWMMRNTASIQINFDIINKKDLEEMVFVADCLYPIAAYLFANSPMQQGQSVGLKNIRQIIWNNTDNNRCLNLIDHGIKSHDNLLKNYINYILNVPGIFQLNSNGEIDKTNKTIGEQLTYLILSETLRKEDIKIALHQIFTNVRLKNLVEVRGTDRSPIGYEMAPVAFWTGLLTEKTCRDEILSIVNQWSTQERMLFNQLSLVLDDTQIGPQGKTYREWNQWAGDLALWGLKKREIGEEKFFNEYFNKVMSKGPFSLQEQ